MSHRRIELPSGKSILAYEGFVGINDEGRICSGYDDLVFFDPSGGLPEEISDLTGEDVVVLCDMMVNRWDALRDRVRHGDVF